MHVARLTSTSASAQAITRFICVLLCNPRDRDRKARRHTGQNACLRRLFPIERGERWKSRRSGIEAPSEHEDVIRVFDVQRDQQRAQRQYDGEHAREPQLLPFRRIRPEYLVDIMHARLHGDDEIAVRRGHDDGQNARQCEARQADREDFNRQRRNDRVGRAVGRDLLRRDELMRDHAHEPYQRDRQPVGKCAEEQALLGGSAVLCRERPLPHLRAGQREDKIGDDIADDAAVDVRLCQLRRQILHKIADPAELDERRGRDQDIHEQDQHDKLEHVRINDAEQAGRGRVDDKYRAGDERAQLIGNADLAAEHIDDRGCRRDLRGDCAHHGERNEAAQHDLGCFSEALLKQVRDGCDAELCADVRDAPGEAGKDEHPKQVRQRRHDGLEAA